MEQLTQRFGSSPDVPLALQVTVAAKTAALYIAEGARVTLCGDRDLDEVMDSVWQQLIDGVHQHGAIRHHSGRRDQ
ncbi:MAG: hypothetical protein ABIQ39_13015 [Ilumatobacteraceae bacterium]